MNTENPQLERFNQLLGQIRQEVDQLKRKNRSLTEENRKLKTELEESKRQSSDVFSALDDSERIALRHQIDGLIARIDQHLEE